ncbi:MAG: efflux RND transporter permease subunit, partial [Planctomycetota bacterium]|nr:efflux RND transporter permease subunit [Planctomycetota bacterium]
GDIDERTLKTEIQRIRNDLRSLPGMGEIIVAGARTDEIAVEVPQESLLKHNISLTYVADRVRQGMIELPGGAVRAPSASVAVRTVGAEERVDEIRDIVIKAEPGGRSIRLGEIADVRATFQDVELRTRLNGKPSVSLIPYAPSNQDTIEIAEMVRAYVAGRLSQPLDLSFSEQMGIQRADAAGSALPPRVAAWRLGNSRLAPPPGEITLHNDLSRFITQRLDLLSRNALWGGVLVFLTLVLLLAPRVAFWVTVGLIVSVLGTLAVMRFFDISLNLLTMFGLIIVLGLLVDDAIVVAENITARHENGEPALAAAINGANQVKWPVVATILTTICAFWPLRLVEGRIGDIIGALPLVVACALLVSLVESLLILPSHMAHDLMRAERAGGGRIHRISQRLERARTALLNRYLIPAYLFILKPVLRARYLSLTIALAVLIASVGMVAGGRVPFNFISSSDSEFIIVDIRMPIGTPVDRTNEIVERIEQVALTNPEIQTVLATVGGRQDVDTGLGVSQGHLAQMNLELAPAEDRERSSEQLKDAIRAELGDLPGVKSLRFTEIGAGPSGPDITLTVVSENESLIAPVVDKLKHMLAEYRGVGGIADDADAGQRELRLKLRPGASELGFTVETIARQIRAAVYGVEAHTFPGEQEDVDVRVMLDQPSRRSLAAIESMYVFSPSGEPAPLREVVQITEAESYATIHRLNRQRAITVTADVDRKIANPEEIIAALRPELREITLASPGVRIVPRGRQEDVQDSFRSLPLGAAAAAGLVFVILSWLFASYVQPLVILFAIPFAIVGAIWGHFLLGFDISILSLIGFVALIGIVVNDSLILIRFYNERREEGAPVYDALVSAGAARLRAIMLTTITTVLGLSPLMAEQSFQARILIPMAITISFGLMAATVITLIILPCLLMIGDDIARIARYLWTGGAPRDDRHLVHVRSAAPSESQD